MDLIEKVVERIRSDNDSVFRSHEWGSLLRKLGIAESHSVPYCPPQNGVVERFMRTLGTNLRANLNGVDPRLWCYCGGYI